jgi:hypothetical protein
MEWFMRRAIEFAPKALGVGFLLCACLAQAGTTVLVIDPQKNGVQSDVYREPPAPEERIGKTDVHGRLVLKATCTPNVLFVAHPPDNYYKQGAYCSADGTEVRIEVTPVEVIAQLESNIKAATEAGNQPAVAQIAVEIAYRMKYADPEKSTHYRNAAVVASARTASPKFDASQIWSTTEGMSLAQWDTHRGQVAWASICKESDLVTCTGADAANGLTVIPSTKFKMVLAHNFGFGEGDAAMSPVWLQQYSHKKTFTLMYKDLRPEDFKGWTYAAPGPPK